MLTLAIEQSTSVASAALLEDDQIVEEREWDQSRARGHQLFGYLSQILAGSSIELASVDRFAVGLGPGSFSSLRISLAAAAGMALPGGIPIIGVSSGRAIAADVATRSSAPRIAVVGDARRDRFWAASFDHESVSQDKESFSLMTAEELSESFKTVDIVATPDWDRIGEKLSTMISKDTELIRQRVLPTARTVGLLSIDFETEQAGTVPSPIYMHPPVFVEPRFQILFLAGLSMPTLYDALDLFSF